MMRTATREDVHALWEAGAATVVEALPAEAYEAEHIPGAVNVPGDLTIESAAAMDTGPGPAPWSSTAPGRAAPDRRSPRPRSSGSATRRARLRRAARPTGRRRAAARRHPGRREGVIVTTSADRAAAHRRGRRTGRREHPDAALLRAPRPACRTAPQSTAGTASTHPTPSPCSTSSRPRSGSGFTLDEVAELLDTGRRRHPTPDLRERAIARSPRSTRRSHDLTTIRDTLPGSSTPAATASPTAPAPTARSRSPTSANATTATDDPADGLAVTHTRHPPVKRRPRAADPQQGHRPGSPRSPAPPAAPCRSSSPPACSPAPARP